ncbi:putative L-asparaginase [Saccharopolyspora subtropica]|uniref:Asparaginase n=1 Tax=Saccharopolyspora thermophila TaxID=89367 RepID=A0A917JVK9_9PSEU|nr:asparaginase [Saccharopolyspora subtropica]GGI84545.1 putative L-asparaginase [Saccharopolyspora subtropica]
MAVLKSLLVSLLVAVVPATGLGGAVQNRLLFLATGDTIAYQPRRSAVASGADLLAASGSALPVHVEDVLAEPSWDTTPATMLRLARRVRTALVDDGFDGVVVTHGLDTLEDTAFLTDLLVGPAAALGAVVFTGAGRTLDAPDSDGPGNLAAALTAAAAPALRGAGAVVCCDGELHAARWATLADAGRAAFSSAPQPVLGRVTGDEVLVSAAPPARPPRVSGEPESDVALIRVFPGMPAALLNTAVDAGARGVVLEGTGAGNVPVDLLTTISDLTDWDIPVVIAGRTRTAPGEAPIGAALALDVGAISARGLTATHARSALMVALADGGVEAARKWFDSL